MARAKAARTGDESKTYRGIDEPLKDRDPANPGGSDLPRPGGGRGGGQDEKRAVVKNARSRGARMSGDLAPDRKGGGGKGRSKKARP